MDMWIEARLDQDKKWTSVKISLLHVSAFLSDQRVIKYVLQLATLCVQPHALCNKRQRCWPQYCLQNKCYMYIVPPLSLVHNYMHYRVGGYIHVLYNLHVHSMN